jgi:hypothetical protein
MSFDTSGLSMGSGFSLGVDGTGTISDIIVGATAIYSTGHLTYNSSTAGFYLDKDGNFGVGDSNDYIHFHISNGQGQVNIKASSITLGSEDLSNASKTASNFLHVTPNDGLIIDNNEITVGSGYNLQLGGSGINLRYSSYNLASLTSSKLTFNKPGTSTEAASFGSDGFSVISGKIGNITLDGSQSVITLTGYNRLANARIEGTGDAYFRDITARTLTIGSALTAGETYKADIYGTLTCYGILDVKGTQFKTNANCTNMLYGTTQIMNATADSSATSILCFDHTDGKTIRITSASSKRYKDIAHDLTDEDIQDAWKIQPVLAKYKDGYLMDTDTRNGMYLPMFIAEDVEKYLPEAADYKMGLIEDWNYRFMIPVMFQMIKSLKSEIDALKRR